MKSLRQKHYKEHFAFIFSNDFFPSIDYLLKKSTVQKAYNNNPRAFIRPPNNPHHLDFASEAMWRNPEAEEHETQHDFYKIIKRSSRQLNIRKKNKTCRKD